jgi:hypothetical protein
MTDLSTTFAGINLRTLIVSSSGLSSSVERIRKMAQSGGAVVLKSFEQTVRSGKASPAVIPEGMTISGRDKAELLRIIFLIGKAKASVDIPVLPELHRSEEDRISHQKKWGRCLELEYLFLPTDKRTSKGYESAAWICLAVQEDLATIVNRGAAFPTSPGWSAVGVRGFRW